MSKAQAQAFYAEHEGREFFEGLTAFMSSAPIIAMVLEKENAINSWRELIGPTNSNLAREEAEAKSPLGQDSWSIRALFGTDGQKMLFMVVTLLTVLQERLIFSSLTSYN